MAVSKSNSIWDLSESSRVPDLTYTDFPYQTLLKIDDIKISNEEILQQSTLFVDFTIYGNEGDVKYNYVQIEVPIDLEKTMIIMPPVRHVM